MLAQQKNLYQKVVLLLVVFVVSLSLGCRTAPVQNVYNSPIASYSSGHLSEQEIEACIVRGGAELGWQVAKADTGHMIATLYIRSHTAIVDIFYSADSYEIKYKDSVNLKYNGTKIHKNYNTWVKNLDGSIRKQLSMAAAAHPPSSSALAPASEDSGVKPVQPELKASEQPAPTKGQPAEPEAKDSSQAQEQWWD